MIEQKIDLSKNKKQKEFFYEVAKAANFKSDKRYFFFGSGIRSGKTIVCIAILTWLCKRFPGSK